MKVILPGSEEYERARFGANTRFDIRPKAIVRPQNNRDVQDVLAYIRENNEKFTIRSGGHCAESWSCTTGILIDLSLMKKITLEDDTVTIEGGINLGEVYFELVKCGRAIPCGNCRKVGTLGHSVCGGIGYSVRKYGLLIDRIVSYEIILPNGDIITASKTEHSDLFFALRGYGACNFGIITSIKVRTFPAENVVIFKYVYPFSQKAVLRWLTEIHNSFDTTIHAKITSKGIEITGQSFRLHDGDLPPNTFISTEKDVQYVSFEEAIDALTFDSTPVPKKYKSRMFAKPLTEASIDALISTAQQIQAPNAEFSIEIRQLKGSADANVLWKNATYWIDLALHWKSRDESNNYAFGILQLEILYLKLLPNATPASYFGNCDSSEDNYYGHHYRKLKRIKDKYDPEGLFRYPQGIVK